MSKFYLIIQVLLINCAIATVSYGCIGNYTAEVIDSCIALCALRLDTFVYLHTGGDDNILTFVATDELLMNSNIKEARKCLSECITGQCDSDLFTYTSDYGYMRDVGYEEAEHALRELKSDIYGYTPWPGEQWEVYASDTNGHSDCLQKCDRPPDNRGRQPTTKVGFTVCTYVYALGSAKRVGWQTFTNLLCGKCYSIRGPIMGGLVLSLYGKEYNDVSIMYWPHHECRSTDRKGWQRRLGRKKTVEDGKSWIWDNTPIGSFWIKCDDKQEWPDADSGNGGFRL